MLENDTAFFIARIDYDFGIVSEINHMRPGYRKFLFFIIGWSRLASCTTQKQEKGNGGKQNAVFHWDTSPSIFRHSFVRQ